MTYPTTIHQNWTQGRAEIADILSDDHIEASVPTFAVS